MDSHQLSVGGQHSVLRALGTGRATLYHLHRLCAAAACCSRNARFFPATRTISLTSGHSAKARMLRCTTVSPPRSKLSLSNPMRVEDPAATRTADTFFSNFCTCPALILPGNTTRGTDRINHVLLYRIARQTATDFIQAKCPSAAGRGAKTLLFSGDHFRMGSMAAARASFCAWASSRVLPRVVK